MTGPKRAEDFSHREFTTIELRIPSNIHALLEELASYRKTELENMALDMIIYELHGELDNDDDMGKMIAEYLRQKHKFRRDA